MRLRWVIALAVLLLLPFLRVPSYVPLQTVLTLLWLVGWGVGIAVWLHMKDHPGEDWEQMEDDLTFYRLLATDPNEALRAITELRKQHRAKHRAADTDDAVFVGCDACKELDRKLKHGIARVKGAAP